VSLFRSNVNTLTPLIRVIWQVIIVVLACICGHRLCTNALAAGSSLLRIRTRSASAAMWSHPSRRMPQQESPRAANRPRSSHHTILVLPITLPMALIRTASETKGIPTHNNSRASSSSKIKISNIPLWSDLTIRFFTP